MIVTASYTANMSTFLSNSRRSNDIADVKALSEQNQVSYGAVYNASTYKFFQVGIIALRSVGRLQTRRRMSCMACNNYDTVTIRYGLDGGVANMFT